MNLRMLNFVFDLCKNVIDFVIKDGEIKLENKLRISSILSEISQIIENTADKLERDEYPHSNCVVLKNLSNQLHFSLIDFVPAEQIDDLHNKLIQASNIEKEFAVRKEPNTIPELRKVAGDFKSLSILIRI